MRFQEFVEMRPNLGDPVDYAVEVDGLRVAVDETALQVARQEALDGFQVVGEKDPSASNEKIRFQPIF